MGHIAIASLFLAILCIVTYRRRFAKLPQTPPGPPAKPLIGNIFQVPLAAGAWKDFTRYKEQYGDLVFLHGLGTNVLVLNSMKAINDLFDKRGNIYSHRPIFTVVGELMKLNQSLALIPYGKEWREHRKLANVALSATAVKRYHVVQENLAALLNKDLLDKPDDFFNHVRLTAARIVMIVTYGFSVSDADDKYITHAEQTMELVTKATVPGAFICDFLPFLKYLPSWVPFQRYAVKGKDMIESLVTRPFEHVKREMAKGTAPPSLAQDLLSNDKHEESFEHRVKWVTGTMYGAGGETTYATVLTFIMAMALHPDKQRLAQAEIDRVVGTERMPTISDVPHLPYVNAVIKETMRWHPAFPLGVARRSGNDDIYEGYLIPKDTIVMANIWAITLEPNEKYTPQAFIPERFLDPSVSVVDPAMYTFGFGRRFCPGRWLGENTVFTMISTILASFDISPAPEGGLTPEFGLDLISYPKPFKCRILPRSAAKAELIRRRAAQCNI
ncbi:hypothetical protein EW146_g251 [Bondarzewia mesenterica]|uniref:Cytochrome P450 n=1 Tax=Bondarzewia mesenterica TaxID=1095465 RepID=A0A4S4M9T8_9AGAM|nr:hypothetical protein EW146_g251 [Bondarzewia mesenterica]